MEPKLDQTDDLDKTSSDSDKILNETANQESFVVQIEEANNNVQNDSMQYETSIVSNREGNLQTIQIESSIAISTSNELIEHSKRLTGQMNIKSESDMVEVAFDIVIPIGPNDSKIVIDTMINHTQKYIIGYRNIYIIAYDNSIRYPNCTTIDERVFPFTVESISIFLIGRENRSGWYLQQLLKLYSGLVIEGLLNNYLVIDVDTIFLKPTKFFENGIPLYNTGSECHTPYFRHMWELHPTLIKHSDRSGITHHMLFQTHIILQLFDLIESYHNESFYIVFLKNAITWSISGASEYEIYFNYLHIYQQDKFIIRNLNWTNYRPDKLNDTIPHDYDYISYHYWFPE